MKEQEEKESAVSLPSKIGGHANFIYRYDGYGNREFTHVYIERISTDSFSISVTRDSSIWIVGVSEEAQSVTILKGNGCILSINPYCFNFIRIQKPFMSGFKNK